MEVEDWSRNVKKFWDDGWTVITFSRSEVAPQCPWSNNKQLHFQVDLENQISLDKALIDLKVSKWKTC